MGSIDQVTGIDARQATTLRKAGVRTSGGLIEKASTRGGRAKLSRATGLSPRDLRAWVNHSDLLRIAGVGDKYSELLVAAGVDTIRDLRRRSPAALLARFAGLNGPRRVVERLPTAAMVEGWIRAAGELAPSIDR